MNLLMSDTPLSVSLPAESRYVDLSSLKIAGCVGCFGCWVKTPGKCVIRDDAVSVYPLIARSKRVLYVTRLQYGSYAVPMKTMLERAIPIQQAFIRLLDGETHHVQRNVQEKDAVIIAYGDIPAEERTVFERLVSRNAKNMLFRSHRIRYVSLEELPQVVNEEVALWENS